MERQRSWVSWAALALAGLALLVALGGRFGDTLLVPGSRTLMMERPAAPRFEWRRGGPGAEPGGTIEREPVRPGFGHGFHGRGQESFGPGFQTPRHGFNPFGMIFGLFGFLTKLAALGLLAWLLLRLFQQRRSGSPPAAPTTPAGHDPRVE